MLPHLTHQPELLDIALHPRIRLGIHSTALCKLFELLFSPKPAAGLPKR
jgi:hypothetical protein